MDNDTLIDANHILTKNVLSATDYSKMEHRDQIYANPDMYIGGDSSQISRVERLLDFTDTPKFIETTITWPSACERLFLELLYNASDNVIVSREKNHDVGTINIMTTKDSIIIKNGGIAIPIQIHPTEKIWLPELIFGVLLTSGNYQKKERTGSGKNGYGAKLTNIFSKWFKISIGNPYDKKEYEQIWENGMIIRHNPIIKNDYNGEPYVMVHYIMDFDRFGYNRNEGYPNEALSLYASRAAEIAFTLKVPVFFNNTLLDIQNIESFAKYVVPNMNNNYLIHLEYPEGTQTKNHKLANGSIIKISLDTTIQPIVEMCVIDTPDEATIYSFINSANTKEGGIHVEIAYDIISESIITEINNTVKAKKTDKESRKFILGKSDLKRHMTLIISCRVINPMFTSNEKVKFSKPKIRLNIDDKILKTMLDWEMVYRLYSDLEAKINKNALLNKRKNKKIIGNGIMDAYYAGDVNEGKKCVLYVVEGKSAMGYAHTMKSEMNENLRDYVGIFAQMGKPMNVMTAKLLSVIKSEKLARFRDILGLDGLENVDFTQEENLNKLRYGKLALLMDADIDGKHIIGLILNILYCKYRSLLQMGYVVMIRTPIIRVTRNSNSLKFYSEAEYHKWAQNTSDHSKWNYEYFKGLATNEPKHVADETKSPKIAYMIYDDTTPKYFNLAFDKKLADSRKKWISEYQLLDGIEDIQLLPISNFLNYELVQHAVGNLGRSIPRFDGLKNGQRKIIYGSYLEWKSHIKNETCSKIKVNILGNSVSKSTNYHYGEKSLYDTINLMVLEYPGTNNMPYFANTAMFGTRNAGGDDAGAERYTKTYPTWWWSYIFKEDDIDILKHVYDEGEHYEPEVYLPIIPLFMVNGALGIGTGSSTFIPNFNPIDLCLIIKKLISNITVNSEELIPWYRGYTGKINLGKLINTNTNDHFTIKLDNGKIINIHTIPREIKEENKTNVIENENEDEEIKDVGTLDQIDIEKIEDNSSKCKYKMVIKGIFNIIDKYTLEITEIPIGTSLQKYNKFLNQLVENKQITSYKDASVHDSPRFIINNYKACSTLEKLNLIKGINLTNMVLLDNEDRPIKFTDHIEMITKWYEWRLPYYQKRKDFILQNIINIIDNMQNKIKFIISVINGTIEGYKPGETIVIMNQPKSVVLDQMKLLNLPEKLFKDTKLHTCTLEKINKLKSDIEIEIERYNKLLNTKPEELWIYDLNVFISEYLKKYPDEKNRLHD